MKGILLIFSLFLSCLFSGSGQIDDVRTGDTVSLVVEAAESDAAENSTDFNDLAIMPVRTASYSGDGNSFAPSVRSNNTGRRVQSSSRSTFRVIKDGKVIDRHNFCTFRATLLQFPSGIHAADRYIYSICNLLI